MADSQPSSDVVRLVLVLLAVLVGIPFLLMALFVPLGMMGAWGVGMHDGFGPNGGFGGIGGIELAVVVLTGLLPLVLLVGGGYLLYRYLQSDGTSFTRRDPAVEELRLAYARGDLTDEEYKQRRDQLTDERRQGS